MLVDELWALPACVSDWEKIDANRVKAFADATQDWQFLHLDDARAAAETPFGGAILHGFLTLSMLTHLSQLALPELPGVTARFNYGFDRVRFVSPVRVGSEIRGRFLMASVDEGDGFLDVHWDVEIEIRNQEKPALVAHWITRFELEKMAERDVNG